MTSIALITSVSTSFVFGAIFILFKNVEKKIRNKKLSDIEIEDLRVRLENAPTSSVGGKGSAEDLKRLQKQTRLQQFEREEQCP